MGTGGSARPRVPRNTLNLRSPTWIFHSLLGPRWPQTGHSETVAFFTSTTGAQGRMMMGEAVVDTQHDLDQWRGLLQCGGWAALGSVALTVVQIGVFVMWPPAETVPEIFDVMRRSPVLGLLSMDALYLVNNLLVLLLYLALAVVLWPVSRSAVALILALGVVQIAAYYASNPAVEMLTLARTHARAQAPERTVLEDVGEAVLAGWTGTAFLVYYFLGASVLLILAWLLRRTAIFPASAAWWALAAGLLMLVPSPFGLVGMVFAILSLLPWSVFCVLVGFRLIRLASS